MHIRALRGLMVALLALAGTVLVVMSSTITTLIQLTATTALIMGGTGMKALGDPHQWGPGTYLEQVNDTYLDVDPANLHWVSTPEHFWPATGLTDLTFDTSVARGMVSLDDAIRTTTGTKVVVGYSQSANIATREKRHLDQLRAEGAPGVPDPDDLSFILVANPNRPNGGILARFEGLYIPLLGVSFDGATPDDEYATVDVARQFDLIADFPKYPLNLLADVNALMGYFYLHPNYGSFTVDLADPSSYQSHTSGNTTYYLVYTEQLPLLQPLRDIGFPEPALDLVEPALRVLIELAYDRTPEHMGVPTRAQLFADIDADKLVSDLTAALRQGVHDALDDLGIEIPQPQAEIERPDDAEAIVSSATEPQTEPVADETITTAITSTNPEPKKLGAAPKEETPEQPRSVESTASVEHEAPQPAEHETPATTAPADDAAKENSPTADPQRSDAQTSNEAPEKDTEDTEDTEDIEPKTSGARKHLPKRDAKPDTPRADSPKTPADTTAADTTKSTDAHPKRGAHHHKAHTERDKTSAAQAAVTTDN